MLMRVVQGTTMTILALLVAMSWAGVSAAADATAQPVAEGGARGDALHALITTKFGDMELRFFPDKAPKHVANFLKLSRQGFYDGTIFHRIIPGFMIQGGDPYTKDPGKKSLYGTGGPGHSVNAEFNDIPHKRGIVSMARSRDPNSAGSQFYIVVKDSPFLDGEYTVFAEVVKGMEVADKIVSQPRDMRDNPVARIEMQVKVME